MRQSGWFQLAVIHVVVVVAPSFVIIGAGPLAEPLRSGLNRLVAVAYLLTSAVVLVEALTSARRRTGPASASDRSRRRPVDLTVVLVAYLPNEQDVIIDSALRVLDDLDHPEDRLQVIVAYNTPEPLPVEAELRLLEWQRTAFEAVRVPDSTSKAENLAAALELAHGDVTVILDSDHHLEPDAARRALRWFDDGYDVVQGRCVVRNQRDGLLTRIVSIEFEQIYGLAHAGRSLLMDTAIFGGANGWWRTDVLRTLGFDRTMLTEDIDASMRAMLTGHRIVHDRSVISTELAPDRWGSWWKQRTRWAQGWLQVTIRHQRAVLRSPMLPWWLKAYWTILLLWREAFPVIATQIFTLLATGLVLTGGWSVQFDPLVAASALLTLTSGVVAATATWYRSTPLTRGTQGPWRYVAFGAGAVLYTALRNTVALVAVAREAFGDDRWVVTARSSAKQRTMALALTAALAASAGGPVTRAWGAEATTRETWSLVPAAVATQTIGGARASQVIDLAVPGDWKAATGRLVLRLDGSRRLTPRSRIDVRVNGRQVISDEVRAGAQILSGRVPMVPVDAARVRISIEARLSSSLATCPPPNDPTATAELLAGSALELQPTARRPLTLREAPTLLSRGHGLGPGRLTVRFDGPASPEGVAAASEIAATVAASQGQQGLAIRVAPNHVRPTILIRDRPGPPRLRLSRRDDRATLTVAGRGQGLLEAAAAFADPALRGRRAATMRVTTATAPAPPLPPAPRAVSVSGARGDGASSATARSDVSLPGYLAVDLGARLVLRARVEAAVPTETSVRVNGRVVLTRGLRAGTNTVAVDEILAGRDAGARTDLRPNGNVIEVTSVAEASAAACATTTPITVEIEPGDLTLRARPRRTAEATLATWPYPLVAADAEPGPTVVLPPKPRRAELAAAIEALVTARMLLGSPLRPRVQFGGDPPTARPALVLTRPGEVPTTLGAAVAGGAPKGTLAVVPSSPVLLAVGPRALRTLGRGFDPAQLNALTVDVRPSGVRVRTPARGPLSATVSPDPSRRRWPLAVLGFAIAASFLLLFARSHSGSTSPGEPNAGASDGAAR